MLPAAAAPPAPPDERTRIARALEAHDWNVSKVSRVLQIPRMTLYRRLRRYGLERPSARPGAQGPENAAEKKSLDR